MTTSGEPIEYRCLIRATDGKKTISTSVSIFFLPSKACLLSGYRIVLSQKHVHFYDWLFKHCFVLAFDSDCS